MNAIELRGLSHIYRNGRGVFDIDLTVQSGEVFGFLGPNGAGKTTLIRTMLGLLHPTAGGGRVLGLDIVRESQAVRRRTGYLPGDAALYGRLSGYQNIDFALAVRGVADRTRLLELAERLDVNLRQSFRTLSRGNRQKVSLLAALAHDPELLILDEPTNALDPLVQDTVRAIIREERARGKTVFMSSHDLAEVEALSDRVGIIRDGRMAAVDEVAHLRRSRMKHVSAQLAPADGLSSDASPGVGERSGGGSDLDARVGVLAALPGVSDLKHDGARVRFTYAGELMPLMSALASLGLTDLSMSDPPLEEIFLSFYSDGRKSEVHGQ